MQNVECIPQMTYCLNSVLLLNYIICKISQSCSMWRARIKKDLFDTINICAPNTLKWSLNAIHNYLLLTEKCQEVKITWPASYPNRTDTHTYTHKPCSQHSTFKVRIVHYLHSFAWLGVWEVGLWIAIKSYFF